MTGNPTHKRLSQDSLSDNERVRLEIQRFLEALRSYPAHAAKEPDLTFEQHLSALVSYSFVPRRSN